MLDPQPLTIVKGEGAYVYREDGSPMLDAIASWWVNTFGHCNPYIVGKIQQQAEILEQVIFSGYTHPQAEKLAARLLKHLPENHSKIFFTDDGSTAVEVALKMAWQLKYNRGEELNRVIALEHAYHGDTFGAMSVSGRSVFNRAFGSLLFEVDYIPSPAENSEDQVLNSLKQALSEKPVALILEPLIQGAGGMKMYPPSTLDKIVSMAQDAGCIVIFDEVMTGFGRTGKMFAKDHLKTDPDIMCMSKGLTAGFLPLGLTSASREIYEAFLSEDRGKTLFHGHSFTANPLSCAAANASLDLFEQDSVWYDIEALADFQSVAVDKFRGLSGVRDSRAFGTVLALSLESGSQGYLENSGREICTEMQQAGYLMRPLGDVVYTIPPYVTPLDDLQNLYAELENQLVKRY